MARTYAEETAAEVLRRMENERAWMSEDWDDVFTSGGATTTTTGSAGTVFGGTFHEPRFRFSPPLWFPRTLHPSVDGERLNALRVLGLEGEVSQAQIRDAYRRRARKTHPDAGGDADEFRAVRAAFEVLGGK